MLFNTHILPLLGSGPAWMSLVQINADMCKKNWWPNLFFIQNYWGVENICLTNTHYVAVDTQLFAISPLITWLIWKWPKRGSLFVGFLVLFSSFLRYYASYTHQLSIFIAFGSRWANRVNWDGFSFDIPHSISVLSSLSIQQITCTFCHRTDCHLIPWEFYCHTFWEFTKDFVYRRLL